MKYELTALLRVTTTELSAGC